jgi:hypothetical protein
MNEDTPVFPGRTIDCKSQLSIYSSSTRSTGFVHRVDPVQVSFEVASRRTNTYLLASN